MLHIEKALAITHAVADRPAAVEHYRQAMNGEVFFDGVWKATDRDTTFVLVNNVCVELIDPPELPTKAAGYLKRYGGFVYAVTFLVANVAEARRHFQERGIGIEGEGDRYFTTDPRDTLGTTFAFTEVEIPNDPRFTRPGARLIRPQTRVEDEASSPSACLWYVTVLAKDVDQTSEFFLDVLGGRLIGKRGVGEYSNGTHVYELGASRISVIEPKTGDPTLSAVMDRQGGMGIHGICVIVEDLEAAARELRSHGVAIMGSPQTRLTTHPRSAMGARFILVPPPEFTGPTWIWSAPEAGVG